MQSKLYEYLKSNLDIELIIVEDHKEAKKLSDVASYLSYQTFTLPDIRANYGDDLRAYKDEFFEFLKALSSYYNSSSKSRVIISPIRTILNPFIKEELFKSFEISFGDSLDINELKERLFNWGYSFCDIVQERAEVSFRGDIIDIFTNESEYPIRVSLFDNEVESIRYIDITNQKSFKDELESFRITPAYFALDSKSYQKYEQRVLELDSDSFVKDIQSLGYWVLDEVYDPLDRFKAIKLYDYEQSIEEIFSFLDKTEDKKVRLLNLETISEPKEYKDIEVSDIKSFLSYHKDKKIKLLANSDLLIKQHEIQDIKFEAIYKPYIINIMSKDEIIVSLNRDKKSKRRKRSTIVLDELNVGDYVVHEEYGVGIFEGLVNTKVLGSVRDFVQIAYQNDDKVLLPVENLDLIDRYIADGGSVGVVDKLGKGSFTKLKSKVKEKLFKIAKELVEIAAKRELVKAPVIRSDFEEIALFVNDAGFAYTKDQKESIKDIFADLSSGMVMDRLLSGDVGFGKTEVAMNAILATIKSGYQAALIAPTTLLVSQHFKTVESRLKKYGVRIEKIDRFVSAAKKRKILESLQKGEVDLCVGTHSIFGVKFKNLGLVVLDEEHKFGVKQKESLKSLRENVHILSMSATPIPRSLNMALSSVKSYSTLLTPPSEREDVRTFVKEFDDAVIKEAILRERRRGGQIFYIHNAIASIEQKRSYIQSLVPDLKIVVLHSKVSPSVTEKEILKFENREYDILISTSIVESGIHIPNVNTIIVDNANRFGMADLHQLRGRVGRGNRQGYCYYLVKDKDELSEDAIKRLVALESNSFLGAGSVLAYHDLEIRGGGNLIGEAQSGHIKGVGYSLYLRMLEESIKELLHGNIDKDEQKKQSCEIKLSVSAFISSDFIAEDRIRLELYRRLSKCESVSEVYEIEEEITDRFGKVDRYTKQFLELIIIKILAKEREVIKISNYQENITIEKLDDKIYLKSRSKDDDDIIASVMEYLRGN